MMQSIFQHKKALISAFACYFLFLSYYALAVHNVSPLHVDMLEAYVWGQNPSLGYYKHPPFWAWVTSLWFYVFPVSNWAFLLLCAANSTLGLIGLWRIYERFAAPLQREPALLLLLLTPFYTFNAIQFNANTIFLSLWPWTLFFFFKSLENHKLRDAILFGIVGAAMMLSKYSAIFLLLSCLIAALLHPQRKTYFRSLSPWLSICVIAILCVPHLLWLIDNHFPTLTYVEGRLHKDFIFVLSKSGEFIISMILQFVLVLALVAISVRGPISQFTNQLKIFYRDDRMKALLVLAFLPSILIFVSGLASSIKLSVNLTNPFYGLVPLILVLFLPHDALQKLVPMVRKGVLLILILIAIAAPFINYLMLRFANNQLNEPWIEASQLADRVWGKYSPEPLRVATGSNGYGDSMSFYGKTHPVQWTELNFSKSPWVTSESVCHQGVLSICLASDRSCIDDFRALAPEAVISEEHRVARAFWGATGPQRDIVISILPPNSCRSFAMNAQH